MKPRAVVQPRDRTPAQKARRKVAQVLGFETVRALRAAPAMADPEVAVEAARFVIRALTDLIEERGDLSRAQGILAGAQAAIAPTYEDKASHAIEAAQAAFRGPQ